MSTFSLFLKLYKFKKLNRRISFIIFVFILFVNCLSSLEDKEEIIRYANLFMDMLEYDLAIQQYKKFLSFQPISIDVRKNIAYAYFKTGWFSKAIEYLKEELTLFPENGDAYDLLIYILHKANRIEEAYTLWEKFNLKIESKVKTPNIGLGDFIIWLHLIENEKFNEAEKCLERAKLRKGFLDKFYAKLIERELKRNDPTSYDGLLRCKRLINEAVNLFGKSPQFIFLEGILYYREFLWKSTFYTESKKLLVLFELICKMQ